MSLALTLVASQAPPYGTVAYRLIADIRLPPFDGARTFRLRVFYQSGDYVDVPITIPGGYSSAASSWREQVLPAVLYTLQGVVLPTSGTLYDSSGNVVAQAQVQIYQEQLPQGYARSIILYGLQPGDDITILQTYASFDKNIQPNLVSQGGNWVTYVVVVPNFSSIFQLGVVRNNSFYIYTKVVNFTDPDPVVSVNVPVGDNYGHKFDVDSNVTAVVFDPADYDAVAGLSTLVTLPKQIGQFNLSYSSQAAAYTSLPTSGVDIHSAAPVMSFMSYSDYCASTGQCAGIPAYNYHDQSWSSQTVQPAAYLGIYSGTRASSLPAVRASSELPGMVLQGIERSEFLNKIEEALLKAAPSAADVDKVVADTVPTKTGFIRK
ncbi:MAG: hypothetical protein ACP5I3_12150, partial [Thermoproteus sp.]